MHHGRCVLLGMVFGLQYNPVLGVADEPDTAIGRRWSHLNRAYAGS